MATLIPQPIVLPTDIPVEALCLKERALSATTAATASDPEYSDDSGEEATPLSLSLLSLSASNLPPLFAVDTRGVAQPVQEWRGYGITVAHSEMEGGEHSSDEVTALSALAVSAMSLPLVFAVDTRGVATPLQEWILEKPAGFAVDSSGVAHPVAEWRAEPEEEDEEDEEGFLSDSEIYEIV